MKEFGAFNDLFIVFDYIKPDISINNNKDKILIKGNENKREVSLLLEYNEKNIVDYNNSNINLVINNINEYHQEFENINNIVNSNDYLTMEKKLEKLKLNNDLCLEDNSHNCNDKIIIRPSLVLTNNNLPEIKNKVNNGSIILIKKSVSTDVINLFISFLQYKDIAIVKLSKLISEKNS